MHELRRMAYLEQLGIDGYISRQQLPGAAPTTRLVLVRSELAESPGVVVPELAPPRMPQFDAGPAATRTRSAEPALPASAATTQRSSAPELRFRLSTVVAGPFLWLESLGEMPLASEQLNLIRAMAWALAHSLEMPGAAADAIVPDVAQFDWPMHRNKQLDHGEEAAQASLLAFLQRRAELSSCTALVILGDEAARWLVADTLQLRVVRTAATTQMLADPSIKAEVWADLAQMRDPR